MSNVDLSSMISSKLPRNFVGRSSYNSRDFSYTTGFYAYTCTQEIFLLKSALTGRKSHFDTLLDKTLTCYAFSLSRCIECDLVLCGSCIADHKRSCETVDHRIINMKEDSDDRQSLDTYSLTFCRYHTRNVIKYFCNTCDEAVCRVCTILEHREHQFVYPKEAIPQQKTIIEELLIQTKKHIPVLKGTITRVRRMAETLKECRESILHEITAKTQARIDGLLQSKENLVADLNRIYAAKQKTLSLQIDAVELELGKISGCCDFADNVLKFGNEVEVLQIKSRLQELNSISINLDPEEDDSIQYISESNSIQTSSESLGSIYSSQTFASLSYAEGEGLENSRVGIESSIVVHAHNRHGKKETGRDRVEAVLVIPDETRKTLIAEDNGKIIININIFSFYNYSTALRIEISASVNVRKC